MEMGSNLVRAVKNQRKLPGRIPEFLSCRAVEPAQRLHRKMEGYEPTPLVSLDQLAKVLGVKKIFIKDESHRFGLRAFKGLGGLYALTRIACKELGLDYETVTFDDLLWEPGRSKLSKLVFVTATDGNHGKGIAWACEKLGCKAHIYMPAGSSPIRAQAISQIGNAQVEITDKGYDDTVRYAADLAAERGWYLVQDTSWPGYEEIPSWIIQGYTTMAAEALDQMEAMGCSVPTHVYLQAGVGAMAGGLTGYLVNRCREQPPVIAVVEPEHMACIYESFRVGDGAPHRAVRQKETIMAGLSCGEPCTVTWPILRDFCTMALCCSDSVAALGMRILAAPLKGDPAVVSGESGAVTMGALAWLATCPDLAQIRSDLGLDGESVVLLFSTEGDTDPDRYKKIVYGGEYSL